MIHKYPYTDFNEYNLDWVIERVKTLTEDWITTRDEWTDTKEEWEELYTYVHDYFDNLDVSQEVGQIIDDYRRDGTLATICQPIVDHWVEDNVPAQIDSWLNSHVTQETGYVLDSSLTLANAAAPAKTVGDALTDVNDALEEGEKTYSKSRILNDSNLLYNEHYLFYVNPIIDYVTELSDIRQDDGGDVASYKISLDNNVVALDYPVFKSSAGYGSFICNEDDVVVYHYSETTVDGVSSKHIDLPQDASYLILLVSASMITTIDWNVVFYYKTTKDNGISNSNLNNVLKHLLNTDYEILQVFDWGDKISAYDGKAFPTTNAIGKTLNQLLLNDVPSLINYRIDVSSYEKIVFPVYRSQSGLGSLFVDNNGVICGVYTNTELDSGSLVTIDVPTGSKYLYFSRNINWSTNICFVIGAFSVIEAGNSEVIIIRDNSYPSLTAEEKTQIVGLCNDYYSVKSNFLYGGSYRNQYADQSCIYSNKFLINCGNFAQFIWMGRSASDFNVSNYTPYITKEFDWGYYFDFTIHKRCYGIYKDQTAQSDSDKYYGYQHPTGSNPYSFNTYDNGSGMTFRTFMSASDLANELFNMGCEIPRSAVEEGDLIFYRGPEYSGMTTETQLNFREISHVAIVIDANYQNTGDIRVMESTFYDPSGNISINSLYETSVDNKLRAGFYDNRIVMCARHPHAFGATGNVPSAITAI